MNTSGTDGQNDMPADSMPNQAEELVHNPPVLLRLPDLGQPSQPLSETDASESADELEADKATLARPADRFRTAGVRWQQIKETLAGVNWQGLVYDHRVWTAAAVVLACGIGMWVALEGTKQSDPQAHQTEAVETPEVVVDDSQMVPLPATTTVEPEKLAEPPAKPQEPIEVARKPEEPKPVEQPPQEVSEESQPTAPPGVARFTGKIE